MCFQPRPGKQKRRRLFSERSEMRGEERDGTHSGLFPFFFSVPPNHLKNGTQTIFFSCGVSVPFLVFFSETKSFLGEKKGTAATTCTFLFSLFLFFSPFFHTFSFPFYFCHNKKKSKLDCVFHHICFFLFSHQLHFTRCKTLSLLLLPLLLLREKGKDLLLFLKQHKSRDNWTTIFLYRDQRKKRVRKKDQFFTFLVFVQLPTHPKKKEKKGFLWYSF
mmetsp:Transcript_39970/g.103129  ORF Transcript_39970/g.103129 Transcript_39970/m.103129 type:complete len:218 (-) Transcript_39970:166-819(-)